MTLQAVNCLLLVVLVATGAFPPSIMLEAANQIDAHNTAVVETELVQFLLTNCVAVHAVTVPGALAFIMSLCSACCVVLVTSAAG